MNAVYKVLIFVFCFSSTGKFVENLSNMTFTDSFLGSKDHAGVLFFSHTFQPLDGLDLPPQASYLFGLLIQKLEVPWAKVFPLRLLLTLGAQYSGKFFGNTLIVKRKKRCFVCIFIWIN